VSDRAIQNRRAGGYAPPARFDVYSPGDSRTGYFLGADGTLMPTRKDQAPPDLRYFKSSRK
jgi:hypothetical protein